MQSFDFEIAFAIFPLVITILLLSWRIDRLDSKYANGFLFSYIVGLVFISIWVSATWFGVFDELSEKASSLGWIYFFCGVVYTGTIRRLIYRK